MLSGSADGLVRLWNVGSGESINTFDQHNDKVWSLDAPSDADLSAAASWIRDKGRDSGDDDDSAFASSSKLFVSGGSDSCVRHWVDRTKEEEEKRLEEQEQLLLHSQQLDNDVRQGNYSKVGTITFLITNYR